VRIFPTKENSSYIRAYVVTGMLNCREEILDFCNEHKITYNNSHSK